MTFYSEMADMADDLLTELGQAVTLNRVTTGSYDPSTGSVTSSSSSQIGMGAIFDYKAKYIDGTLIKAGDKRLLLSPNGITTTVPGDTVTIGGITYTVTAVNQTNPAGTAVRFELNLRGA